MYVYQDQISELSKCLKVVFGLPFLSPNLVNQCIVEDIMAIQPAGDKILDYVFETNIDLSGLFSFSNNVWAMFKATTINSCKSFHSKLNGIF